MHHPLSAGGEGLSLLSNSQKEALTGTQSLKEGFCERRGELFQGSYSFYIKNKLKAGIFNDKKSL